MQAQRPRVDAGRAIFLERRLRVSRVLGRLAVPVSVENLKTPRRKRARFPRRFENLKTRRRRATPPRGGCWDSTEAHRAGFHGVFLRNGAAMIVMQKANRLITELGLRGLMLYCIEVGLWAVLVQRPIALRFAEWSRLLLAGNASTNARLDLGWLRAGSPQTRRGHGNA